MRGGDKRMNSVLDRFAFEVPIGHLFRAVLMAKRTL